MLKPKDEWCGRLVRETALPSGLMIAVILRGTETKMPTVTCGSGPETG